MHSIKIDSQKIKLGDNEVDKKEFYSSRHAILLDSVDLSKIVVSNISKINDTTCKYLCGYLNDDVARPLCVILLQMNGYINILTMVQRIGHLLQMIKNFIQNTTKYGT